MRLKSQHQPPTGKRAAHRRHRRRHLHRVMAVIVDQREAAAASHSDFAVALEAPSHAFKFRQRMHNALVGHAHFHANRNRRQRVQHVMNARQIQCHRQICGGTPIGGTYGAKTHLPAAVLNVHRAYLRLRRQAVGGDRLGNQGNNRADIGVVLAQHRHAVERQAMHEIDKRLLQIVERVAVGLHVIGVDIGHHRQHRLQMQKRCVRLVGFDHDELACA